MSISNSVIEQYKLILGQGKLPLAWSELELDRLGIRSVHSLRRDRVVGGGIPFIKDKGSIRYPVLEVLEWMHKNLKTSSSQ
jgi:hypothetical protein